VPTDHEATAGVSDLLAFQVDGIISSAALPVEVLAAANRQRVPVVLFNRAPSGMLASSVACDHAAGMEELVAHLADGILGRTVILAGPEGAPVSEQRSGGARSALAARGLPLETMLHSDYSYDGGRATVLRVFSRTNFPRTLICANDTMALGAMDAFRFDLGLDVPGDVQVTGFDDVPQAGWPSYALTTLRQPVRHMAESSVRLLLDKLSGVARSGERRLMPAELQQRGTTRMTPTNPSFSIGASQ
jgi:DNA-binding LacI/PurR family transcriptional regulator